LRSSAIFALALRSSSLLHLPSVLTKVIVCPNYPTRPSETFIGRAFSTHSALALFIGVLPLTTTALAAECGCDRGHKIVEDAVAPSPNLDRSPRPDIRGWRGLHR
jgi:hypothetical protein